MRLLGFKELREYWPVSRPTVGRHEGREHDPFPRRVWIGGRCFWPFDPVMAWLARNAVTR